MSNSTYTYFFRLQVEHQGKCVYKNCGLAFYKGNSDNYRGMSMELPPDEKHKLVFDEVIRESKEHFLKETTYVEEDLYVDVQEFHQL